MSTTAKVRNTKATPPDAKADDTAAKDPGSVSGFELVNPGTASMAYDDQGHVLGGGERVAVDKVDEVARVAVRRGFLLCQDSTGEWIGFDPVADPPAEVDRPEEPVDADSATTETGQDDGGASHRE